MLDTYMNALDLQLLSIYRMNGQEWPLLPGLLAQNPPKKFARGRDQDRLLVYLTLSGNVSYSASEYAIIIAQVADTFYSTPGSLTFALKTAAETLNTYLVERNMKSTGKGLYSIGSLVLCNLRANSMYIVQAGPTHVYHLSKEARHLYDPLLAGKGLGLSQKARMYFSQVMLAAGDRLLLCAALPPNWEKSINNSHGSTALETTRRRLLAITDTNISALLVQVADGSGVMNIQKAVKDLPVDIANMVIPELEAASDARPIPIIEVEESPTEPDSPAAYQLTEAVDDTAQMTTPETAEQANQPQAAPTPSAQPPSENRFVRTSKRNPETTSTSHSTSAENIDKNLRAAARFLAASIQFARSKIQNFTTWAEHAIPRLMPDNDEEQLPKSVSRSWSIFFAVAIPVITLLIARIVYYQLGFEAQYKIYFDHAAESAQLAVSETDPSAMRVEWQIALDWLDKADQYVQDSRSETQELRQKAQTSLDKLDKVARLKFTPAFNTSLSENLQVSRITATDTDVYLLNAVNGSVLRGIYNGKNYDLDNRFQCGPGTYPEIKPDATTEKAQADKQVDVSRLIEIISLPRSKDTSITLLGIDASGGLIYCSPGAAPQAAVLQPPLTGWKNITAVVYDNQNLYLLDAEGRGVWIYYGTEKVQFGEPIFFFGEQIPVMIEQAIDMAVNGDDLYLLHQDGHMTTCILNHLETSTTRCNDPALYIDTRPGYEGGMKLSDGIFSQMFFTSPPDPSVALLEPFTQSIYRFSPRALELQNQVRSLAGKENTLPKGKAVTAMTFSPNKIVFMFIDGQLYHSVNTP